MAWLPISAWVLAVVLALVVLGFCVYEITWKTRRLLTDVARLRAVRDQLTAVQVRLAETQRRISAAGLR